MHAFVITGATKENRNKKIQELLSLWSVSQFDQYILVPEEGKDAVGIERIRDLTKYISLSPRNSPWVVGIIPDAQNLTLQAQNALLKTLEEPPAHVRIILETDAKDILLPTILSRTTAIVLPQESHPSSSDAIRSEFDTVTASLPGHILSFVDQTFPTREKANQYTVILLSALKKKLTDEPSLAAAKHIALLLEAQKQLRANVNHKLVMDTFFLLSKL